MNASTSNYITRYLSSGTRQAMRAKANEEQQASPTVELLRRVEQIVLGPNVSTLAEARARLASLLDDEQKKSGKPVE